MKEEMKKLKKEKEMEMLYLREERKLFVGGLATETVERDLKKYFAQFGQVIDCQVQELHGSLTSFSE